MVSTDAETFEVKISSGIITNNHKTTLRESHFGNVHQFYTICHARFHICKWAFNRNVPGFSVSHCNVPHPIMHFRKMSANLAFIVDFVKYVYNTTRKEYVGMGKCPTLPCLGCGPMTITPLRGLWWILRPDCIWFFFLCHVIDERTAIRQTFGRATEL